MIKYTEEFKREAVRIALTSGLPRDRVAKDLGIGKSTLGKWCRTIGRRVCLQNLKPISPVRMSG